MCTDVDAGALAASMPVLETDQRALARALIAEVDQRRGAAERGGLGAGAERIDGIDRTEFPVEVRVHVDAAGHDQQSLGVVHFDVRAHREILADGLDLAVDDENVRGVVVDRGHDASVLDQRRSHLLFPFVRCLSMLVLSGEK